MSAVGTLGEAAMLELMAYVDGELEADDLARVEALVASNDEARRIVLSLGGVGDWVRESAATAPGLAATQRIADGIAEGVMAQIAMTAPALAAPISLDASRERARTHRGAAGRTPGRLGRVGAAVVGVLALAAGTLLFLRGDGSGVDGRRAAHTKATKSAVAQSSQSEGPSIGPMPGAASGEAVAQASDDASGVDVEQVESPSHQVSVFYLPAVAAAAAGSNASSVVVWIGDDKAPGGL